MSKTLFTGSFLLIMIWAMEYFVFHKSGLIHILLAIAIIILLFRLVYNKTETP